tara:strand:- start:6319 stop:7323 length:1005 start_codon:yes stop_codon:yes gene_type:complete
MKKNYTVIIASDHKAKTKKMVISAAWMKLAATLVFIFAVLGATAFVDYVGLLFQSVENKRLKAENLHLKNQFSVVKTKLDELEKGLERISVYATKLRLITGPADEENIMRLAMGPIPNAGQAVYEMNEHMDERKPASLLGVKDSVFFQKAPLATDGDEVFAKDTENYAKVSVKIDKLTKQATLREQNIIKLWEKLGNRKSLLRATPAIRPTRGWFTSRFGYRKSPFTGRLMMHKGIDIAAPYGSPIYAAADGIVSYAAFESGYGKLISVDHGYGVTTRYGHASAIDVKVGQKVKRGDIIGRIGDTGRATAPHVHYEVRKNGVPVDPANFILSEY